MARLNGITAAGLRAPKIHLGLLALLLFGLVAVPSFRNPANLVNVVQQSSALAILALGQGFVIAGGLIDLSVGQLVGLTSVLGCAAMESRPELASPIVVGMIVLGGLVGLLNGELVNRLKVPPLILTFGMLSVLQGAIFVVTDRSIGQAAPLVTAVATGTVGGLPIALLTVAMAAVVAYVLLQRSVFGWHLLALGNNAEATRRVGIGVPGLVRCAYLASGLAAGLAAVIVAGRLGTGYPSAGDGMELDSVVAVVLGGTPLAGGRISVPAILSAVLVLGVLSNLLNLLQVPTFTQILIKGLIVIGAILADRPRQAARAA